MSERRHSQSDWDSDWDSSDYWDERDSDWEEEEEEAPEGYYDEDEELYEFSPDDPDYDLSEAAGYADWEPSGRSLSIPQWLIAAISLLLILALLLPVILRFS